MLVLTPLATQGQPQFVILLTRCIYAPGIGVTCLRRSLAKIPQQRIHEKLIKIAKEKLSTTNLLVSEIACYNSGHRSTKCREIKQGISVRWFSEYIKGGDRENG